MYFNCCISRRNAQQDARCRSHYHRPAEDQYRVQSKDDIQKTKQGYKIKTAGGESVRFSEEEMESISIVEE
jgi:hypothetical protein